MPCTRHAKREGTGNCSLFSWALEDALLRFVTHSRYNFGTFEKRERRWFSVYATPAKAFSVFPNLLHSCPFIVSGLRTIASNEVPLTAICTSINENYEGRISHIGSDISTFSGCTVLEGTLQIIPFEHNRSAADASRAMLLTSRDHSRFFFLQSC